jgi:hypothetical protein
VKRDSVITVRVTRAARRRIEAAARSQGRSLSQIVQRLLESGLGSQPPRGSAVPAAARRSLAGHFRGGRVPTLADFKRVRSGLGSSLLRRTGR